MLVERRFVLTRQEASSLKQIDVPVLTAYGCPEIPVICVSALNVCEWGEDQCGSKKGTVGRPLPGICVRIMDPISGQRLPPNTIGLLQAKNATIDKMISSCLTADGWFMTGEQATVDEEGFVTVKSHMNNLDPSEQVDLFLPENVSSETQNFSPVFQP